MTYGTVADEAPTTMRPCVVCGDPAPVQGFGDPSYAVCGWPVQYGDGKGLACVERAEAKRDAGRSRRSAEVAAQAVTGAAEARAQTAPPSVPKKPRPSKARTLLGQPAPRSKPRTA